MPSDTPRPADPSRRRFLMQTSGLLGVAVTGDVLLAADQIPTPNQTTGPFYPRPTIAQQPFRDVDLTRKAADGPVAEGDQIRVTGRVLDLSGQPIKGAVIELWQACASGRYNHPRDRNTAPLDPNFQYWGRMPVDAENG